MDITAKMTSIEKPLQDPLDGLDWERFGWTADKARARGLTRVDFKNWEPLEEEERSQKVAE